MKHVVNLTKEIEIIYQNSAKYLGISVDKMLVEVLEDYLKLVAKEKALN